MKISVIGGGVMGTNHARVLSDLGVLGSIIDKDPSSRERLKARFPNQNVTDSYDSDDSDAFIIATPSSSHFSVAEALLQRNKHILIEKPICTSVDDAVKLKSLVKNSLVSVGLIERYNPIVQYTKKWVSHNNVRTINTYRLSSMPTRIQDVGVIMDLAIHDVDVLMCLAQSKVTSVYAVGQFPSGKKHENYGKIILRFENGIIGTVEVSWLHSFKVRKIDLVSTNFCATADYLQQSFTEQSSEVSGEYINGFDLQVQSKKSEISISKQEPLKLQLENFIASIKQNKSPYVTIDDGIKSLRVIEAAYQSIESKSEIKI